MGTRTAFLLQVSSGHVVTAFQTVKDEDSRLDKTLENSLFGALLQPITRGCQRAFYVPKMHPNHKMREQRMVGIPTYSLTEGRQSKVSWSHPSYQASLPREAVFTFFLRYMKQV